MSALNRFLGDSPLRVLLKLAIASFLVGLVMASLGWSPFDVLDAAVEMLRRIWNMGFGALRQFWTYLVLGAAIVVPAFFILRLLSYGRRPS